MEYFHRRLRNSLLEEQLWTKACQTPPNQWFHFELHTPGLQPRYCFKDRNSAPHTWLLPQKLGLLSLCQTKLCQSPTSLPSGILRSFPLPFTEKNKAILYNCCFRRGLGKRMASSHLRPAVRFSTLSVQTAWTIDPRVKFSLKHNTTCRTMKSDLMFIWPKASPPFQVPDPTLHIQGLPCACFLQV